MLEVLIILGIIWFGLGMIMLICRFINFLMTKFNNSEEE